MCNLFGLAWASNRKFYEGPGKLSSWRGGRERSFPCIEATTAGIRRRSGNARGEGILECGSARYRRSLVVHGGSVAAALRGTLDISVVSERPPADRRERLPEDCEPGQRVARSAGKRIRRIMRRTIIPVTCLNGLRLES